MNWSGSLRRLFGPDRKLELKPTSKTTIARDGHCPDFILRFLSSGSVVLPATHFGWRSVRAPRSRRFTCIHAVQRLPLGESAMILGNRGCLAGSGGPCDYGVNRRGSCTAADGGELSPGSNP